MDDLEEKDYPDVAASFQEAVIDVLIKKLTYAIEETGIKKLVCSGGVAANRLLRERLTDMCKTSELEVSYPKMEFCTDNAAMIAYAGFIRKKYNLKEYPTKYARPRWPLESYMIKKDRIYVEDLRVKGTIGIFDWEKRLNRKLVFLMK